MEFDTKIIRWCVSSVIVPFAALADTNNIPIYVEPEKRSEDHDEFFEVRVDGPIIRTHTKDSYTYDYEINILIQLKIDDIYRMREIQGIVCKAFIDGIQVKKYGDGEDLIGCFDLLSEITGGDNITVSNFGKIEVQSTLEQSSVEAHIQLKA